MARQSVSDRLLCDGHERRVCGMQSGLLPVLSQFGNFNSRSIAWKRASVRKRVHLSGLDPRGRSRSHNSRRPLAQSMWFGEATVRDRTEQRALAE